VPPPGGGPRYYWGMASALDMLAHPIVQAPMAGGPSTPALAAAVSGAGGLGFLAAGYKTIEAVRGDLDELRRLLPAGVPFGINLFAPPGHGAGAADVAAYAATLRAEAARRGAALGEPRWDDDRYAEKLDLVCAERVPVVSLTFGCPSPDDVRRLHDAGAEVWVTVTTIDEARAAQAAGADGLIAQGVEAGGHRGAFDDARPGDLGLLALLQLVRGAIGDTTPLIATGAIATGRGVAAVLAAGAAAAQLGTAFMLCPEAATVPAHRSAIEDAHARTALTRAFTGRTARGIGNRFQREHSQTAPSAYPEVHHLTAPMRAAARRHDDADGFNLWAGQTHPLAYAMPAPELVVQLAAEARAVLAETAERWGHPG
jgi:nitronate monooxygenase